MSPVPRGTLAKRHDNSITVTIVFVVVAVSVIVACVIWGFIIPKWRKKHPESPSRTKWNDGSILTTRKSRRSRRAFPAHPAVKPLLSKPSAAQILPTYNPRIESPFPYQPLEGISRPLSRITRTCSAPGAGPTISSNGLFTPVKRGAEVDQSKNTFHTVPRAVEAKHFAAKSSDFGDAKEFILAVPEPLSLRPRPAGRPPAVTRHLEKFGTPHTHSPAASDKLPHPNKLFEAIQRGGLRSSFCSSTSMRVDHRASDAVKVLAMRNTSDGLEELCEQDMDNSQQCSRSSDENHNPHSVPADRSNGLGHTEDAAAIHLLRSYRSLTGERPAKLVRAGTLTRPKTPVNELTRFYAQPSTTKAIPLRTLPHTSTKSTLLITGDNSSDIDSISTPATTPPLPTSQLDLLPRRLRPHKSSERRMLATNAESLSVLSAPDRELQNVTMPEEEPRVQTQSRVSSGFYQPGRRSKPAPPVIKTDSPFFAAQQHWPRRSLTDFGPPTGSSVKTTVVMASRVRASSMYSGDAHGLGLLPSPSTPNLSTPRTNIFSDHNMAGNPFTGRESVRTRIEEWHQRIEGLSTPKLPLSRPLSPLPEFSDTHISAANAVHGPTDGNNTHLKVDNDHAPGPAPDGKPVAGAKAPGGADWI